MVLPYLFFSPPFCFFYFLFPVPPFATSLRHRDSRKDPFDLSFFLPSFLLFLSPYIFFFFILLLLCTGVMHKQVPVQLKKEEEEDDNLAKKKNENVGEGARERGWLRFSCIFFFGLFEKEREKKKKGVYMYLAQPPPVSSFLSRFLFFFFPARLMSTSISFRAGDGGGEEVSRVCVGCCWHLTLLLLLLPTHTRPLVLWCDDARPFRLPPTLNNPNEYDDDDSLMLCGHHHHHHIRLTCIYINRWKSHGMLEAIGGWMYARAPREGKVALSVPFAFMYTFFFFFFDAWVPITTLAKLTAAASPLISTRRGKKKEQEKRYSRRAYRTESVSPSPALRRRPRQFVAGLSGDFYLSIYIYI